MMIFSICRLKVAEVTVDIIYNLEAVMMELRIQHPHEIVAATNLATKVDEIIDHFIFVYSSNFRIMHHLFPPPVPLPFSTLGQAWPGLFVWPC